MKNFLASILLCTMMVGSALAQASTSQSACAPSLVKPAKEETRLASIAFSPDVLAVDGLMMIQLIPKAQIGGLRVDIPDYFDVVDYSPRSSSTINVTKPGEWTSATQLPQGTYSVTLKAKAWTNYQWKQIGYAASNNQGTGYGSDAYYIYYDQIPIELSLGQENQIPQTTKKVSRKIDLKAKPEASITLKTNKGELGPDISNISGQELLVKANAEGAAWAYIFANEGDKINLTATSSDACQKKTATKDFLISRSDIARTYQDYSWIYWLAGILATIIIVILLVIIKKRKNKNLINYANNIPPSTIPSQSNEISQDAEKINKNLKD